MADIVFHISESALPEAVASQTYSKQVLCNVLFAMKARRGLKRTASELANPDDALESDSEPSALVRQVPPPTAETVFGWAQRAQQCLAFSSLGDAPQA